jgi:NADPH:quinone reductase-like Zn-dependent oxidoreductase
MLETANGSLHVGLDAKADQTLLVRGGTSSIGMATAVLAKRLGMTVLSTTRNPAKAKDLEGVGADHVVVDGGHVVGAVRDLYPDGVDVALELVGTPTLRDTLGCVRVHGVACFTGMLSNQWTVDRFYPIDYIPRGVRLTAYSGKAGDLPEAVLQGFIDDVEADRAKVPLGHVFRFEEIVKAHQAMEDGTMSGKLVVTTGC